MRNISIWCGPYLKFSDHDVWYDPNSKYRGRPPYKRSRFFVIEIKRPAKIWVKTGDFLQLLFSLSNRKACYGWILSQNVRKIKFLILNVSQRIGVEQNRESIGASIPSDYGIVTSFSTDRSPDSWAFGKQNKKYFLYFYMLKIYLSIQMSFCF